MKKSLIALSILVAVIGTVDPTFACAPGMEAYTQTLHKLQMERCSGCHGDEGFAIEHSVSDPSAAYAVSRELVNFENLESSLFMDKIRQAHWKKYKKTGPGTEGATEEEMRTALQAWWDQGESQCVGDRFTMKSNSVDIVTHLGLSAFEGNPNAPLSFNVGACVVTLDFRIFTRASQNQQGSYEVRNLSVMCLEKSVELTGVRVFVSDSTLEFENAYDDVSATINKGESMKLLSPDRMILIQRLPQDVLSVGIAKYTELD